MPKPIALIRPAVLFIATFVLAQNGRQQAAIEQEIRKLDQAEAEAILKNDADAAAKFYADDITVNNPRNTITKGKAALIARDFKRDVFQLVYARALHGDGGASVIWGCDGSLR